MVLCLIYRHRRGNASKASETPEGYRIRPLRQLSQRFWKKVMELVEEDLHYSLFGALDPVVYLCGDE